MKIVYFHEDSGEIEFLKRVYSLRAWKVYARQHADSYGDLALLRNGKTIRCAHVFRHGVVNGMVHSTYREWKV
jgi:hypothetical protein